MDGRGLQVNDALCRITGYTRAELKATTLRALTHPEDVDLDADSLRELLYGRTPSYQVEKRYRHAWGHYVWGLLTVSLVRDDRGRAHVNDAFGHKAGDDLLKGVAGAVRHRIRQTDLLARIGGDEFAVLLPQTDVDQAQVAADGIVKAMGRHVAVLGDRSIRVTASVGLAMFDGLSAAEVLACADLAMYEAKQAGRNRFALYDPSRGRREPAAAPGRGGRRAAHAQHVPLRRRAFRADPGHRRLGHAPGDRAHRRE
jgi:diguanylate cyclase (GGDEF)-like protein